MTASAMGIRSGHIHILGLGGAYIPDNIDAFDQLSSSKRSLVYLAGPACNILLGGLSLWLIKKSEIPLLCYSEGLFLFSVCNLSVGILNLLPIFPLDGGKVLTELLASWGLSPQWVFRTIRISSVVAGGGYLYRLLSIRCFFDATLWVVFIGLCLWLVSPREEEDSLAISENSHDLEVP
jgi:Zn-dependent protease